MTKGRDMTVLRPGLLCGSERRFGETIPAAIIAEVSEPVLSALLNGGYIEPADGSGSNGADLKALEQKVDALTEQLVANNQTMTALMARLDGNGAAKTKPKPRARRTK